MICLDFGVILAFALAISLGGGQGVKILKCHLLTLGSTIRDNPQPPSHCVTVGMGIGMSSLAPLRHHGDGYGHSRSRNFAGDARGCEKRSDGCASTVLLNVVVRCISALMPAMPLVDACSRGGVGGSVDYRMRVLISATMLAMPMAAESGLCARHVGRCCVCEAHVAFCSSR